MAARNRLSGSTLSLKINEQEYNADIAEYKYSEEDKDSGTLTFADAAGGATGTGKLTVELIQSLDSDSLHQQVMDNPGKKDVSFVLAPFGNSKASVTQPHFTGKLSFPRLRPELGIKAGESDATTSVEFKVSEWKKVTV
ncbi:hypothetical protein [Arcanobacterium haemolyticum]